MNRQQIVTDRQIEEFVAGHGLPDEFRSLVLEHYVPLAQWLIRRQRPNETTLLGINGAQGTGKSTLADFIRLALESGPGWRVAVLSLDDFYLTRAERERLGDTVHPLLRTRGVPGTHDVQMLSACLARLRNLKAAEEMRLPRFDKSQDDRADPKTWPVVTGPIDVIVLEGWCVGCPPEDEYALAKPINGLERDRDADGKWRRYVNERLAGAYKELFAQLDALIFLRAPGFDAIYRWRVEQEEKLAATAAGAGLMDRAQVAAFIQYFERLTRRGLESLPAIADVVLDLDDSHDVVRAIYRNSKS